MKIYQRVLSMIIIILLSGCVTTGNFTRSALRMSSDISESGTNYYHFACAQIALRNKKIDRAIYHIEQALQSDPESLYLKRELAFLYIENENYTIALDIFSQIIKKDPGNVEAFIMLGRIKQAEKFYAEAIEAYKKVISLDPKQHDIYFLLGGLYLEKDDTINGLAIFKKMVRHFPDNFTAHYFIGKIYMERGNFNQAEKQFYKTLKLNPDLQEPKFQLAKLYQAEPFHLYSVKPNDTLKSISIGFYKRFNKDIENHILQLNPKLENSSDIKTGQKLRLPDSPKKSKRKKLSPRKINKIIRLYKDILDHEPNNIQAQIELAYFFDTIAKKTDANKLYMEIGKRSKNEASIIVRLVNQYLDKKDFDALISITEGALKGAPQSSDLHHIAGLAYSGIDNNEKALAHFNQVSEHSRFYKDSVIHISYIYQNNNQLDKAITYLQKIIDKYPQQTEYMLFLGSLYEDINAFEKAEKVLKEGIGIDQKNVKLHFRLGVVYDKWGKQDKCIKAMKQVIKIDPKHANALNYLGYTYAEMGKNLDEAERLILEALKFKPDDAYITDSLGWVYYKKGHFAKALEILKKAVSIVPDDPTMLEHLGDAHFQLNNKSDALKYYKMSLEKKDEKEKDKEILEKKIKDLEDKEF